MVTQSFQVRPLSAGDPLLAFYRDLRNCLWPEAGDDCERETAGILANPNRWGVFIATTNEAAMIGFLEFSLREYAAGASSSPVGFIEGWFVAPEFRKRGVGAALVAAAEGWARSRGCTEIASDTPIENAVSIAAHKALRYREVERVVCFVKELDR